MFGKIEFADFKTAGLPQRAASAWTIMNDIIGATYNPVLYCGSQVTNGVTYHYIAEIKPVSLTPITHLAKIAVTEQNGEYKVTNIEIIL